MWQAQIALYIVMQKIDLIISFTIFTDFNLDIDILGKKLAKAKKLNKLPKVVIPVHLGGFPSKFRKTKLFKKI